MGLFDLDSLQTVDSPRAPLAPANTGNIYAQSQADKAVGKQQNDAQMAQLMAQLQSQQGLGQLQAQTSLQQSQIQADASKYPTQVRQQEFNQLFPMYQQGLNTLNSAAASGFATPGGGAGGTQPQINGGPVYNPQDIKGKINASRAQTDAATATQQRTNTQQNAGKGFSSNSPLLSMLNQSAGMSGNATNAQSANDINFNAAQANADQTLKGQQAQEQQYSNRQNEALKRQQNVYGLQSSLYGALGSAMA